MNDCTSNKSEAECNNWPSYAFEADKDPFGSILSIKKFIGVIKRFVLDCFSKNCESLVYLSELRWKITFPCGCFRSSNQICIQLPDQSAFALCFQRWKSIFWTLRPRKTAQKRNFSIKEMFSKLLIISAWNWRWITSDDEIFFIAVRKILEFVIQKGKYFQMLK